MPEKMKRVTGITLYKDDVIIATVNEFFPAAMEKGVDLGIVDVTGDVSMTTGELGYIQLNWTAFPGSQVAGRYMCDVRGVTENRHMVIYNTSLDIQVSDVSMGDLVNEIKDLKSGMVSAKTIIGNLQSTVATQNSEIATLTTNIADLKADMADLRHVEQGTLDCESSSTWTKDTVVRHGSPFYYFNTRRITKSFSSVYTSAPVVFLTTSFRYIPESHHVRYGQLLVDVNTHNFTMLCGGTGTGDDGFSITDMEVDWLSIPV